MITVLRNASLAQFTTLRAGGPADELVIVHDVEDLAQVVLEAQRNGRPHTLLGWGSNVLPSDEGLRGLVVINATRRISCEGTDLVADAGVGYQEVFLFAAQRNLAGLEFAVGIPGTLGGAVVSNAGAYRCNLDVFVTGAEVVYKDERKWVDKEFFQFAYRDSVLRHPSFGPCIVLRVKLSLQKGDPKAIYDLARENQRQRISKQPAPASAGSFFKNVVDRKLAAEIDGLTDGMRAAGVIPSGFLLERVGFKGRRHRGAMFSARHANFLLNVGQASASSLRSLSHHAKSAVKERFGVDLEEEVMFLGDWSGFTPEPLDPI